MPRSLEQLKQDAEAIWRAAVDAVRSDRLVRENVRVEDGTLWLADEAIELDTIGRIEVLGGGKAGAGMAVGLEESLGGETLAAKQVGGWVNVPADCIRETRAIHLHAGRPAGVNEPREEGVAGADEILRRAAALGPDDLCIALISGGGSALMPAPVEGVTLEDKLEITRRLSAAGANIEELNTVRQHLSRIKGGGLARACRAGRLVALIISDVLGDPLDMIASGPTVPAQTTPADALNVLRKYLQETDIPPNAARRLAPESRTPNPEPRTRSLEPRTSNLIIGANAVAVDAAGVEAERRGYAHAMTSARKPEGPAEDVGEHLAAMALNMRVTPGPDCLITGGEPTVKLPPAESCGKGGRNQQLVLAALCHWMKRSEGDMASNLEKAKRLPQDIAGMAMLSGGVDGEDGPTDAAGALATAETLQAARDAGLDPADFLARADAYTFFQRVGGLIKTGPTHTNVCDVRVVVVDREEAQSRGAVA